MMRTSLVECGSGVRLERGVSCAMSDGVKLRSDHYYPAEEGPHPTLLMRQPYGRDIASTVVYAHPIWFARQGYNVVIQDVRGRGDSEGDFYPFRNERVDGAETIAWVRSRPECDGKIGMYGFSYQGATQLLAAVERPPGLMCIAPAMTAHDLYEGWFYHQGALRLASSLGWGLQMLRADARRLCLKEASEALETAWLNLRSQPLKAPYGAHPALRFDDLPSYVLDWFCNNNPGSHWQDLDASKAFASIDVPALHISGWFDTYLKGSIDGFLAMCRGLNSTSARSQQYLLATPWVHIPWGDRAGEAVLGKEALFDTDTYLLRWFNHWLKGTGEFESEPRIRHFALGANRWYTADEWLESDGVRYYLRSSGAANSRKGNGKLDLAAPETNEPADVFVYDPEVPVYAPGGVAALSGPMDQASLELGNNVLVYTSEPLSKQIHVFGISKVCLFCSTSAPFADLTAKLVRVTNTQQAEFVCIGIARSSYLFREGTYVADQIHCWRFSLEPTSCIFSPGERIRLEVASSAFPLYDRNPSTAIAPSLADGSNWARSTQMLFHDDERQSFLNLPIGEWEPC